MGQAALRLVAVTKPFLSLSKARADGCCQRCYAPGGHLVGMRGAGFDGHVPWKVLRLCAECEAEARAEGRWRVVAGVTPTPVATPSLDEILNW